MVEWQTFTQVKEDAENSNDEIVSITKAAREHITIMIE